MRLRGEKSFPLLLFASYVQSHVVPDRSSDQPCRVIFHLGRQFLRRREHQQDAHPALFPLPHTFFEPAPHQALVDDDKAVVRLRHDGVEQFPGPGWLNDMVRYPGKAEAEFRVTGRYENDLFHIYSPMPLNHWRLRRTRLKAYFLICVHQCVPHGGTRG